MELELAGKVSSFAVRILVGLVRVYRRFISPMLGANCRFYPSCSAYAEEALARFGAFRGAGLALWRLAKCHPFHPGGVDPVPGDRR
jgi:putative membrane protein insertion efficiency factor